MGSLIKPVILSGGAGSRLWPLSRPHCPKQLQRLVGPLTMIQATVSRVQGQADFARPIVVTAAQHVDTIQTQLEAIGEPGVTFILEPAPRNTAPAIATAALTSDPDALLLILPSDHVIADVDAFLEAVRKASPLAEDGWLVTFGIKPTRPETGYGYIRRGEELESAAFRCDRFVEKPALPTAHAYVREGRYLWNGGIFLFRADRVVEEMAAHAPDVYEGVRHALDRAERQPGRILLSADEWAAIRSLSFDVAVMERADRVAVVAVDMGWSDVGNWNALYDIGEKTAGENVIAGDVIAIDTEGCLVRAEKGRVVTIGVRDLVVIVTDDAVLVVPRDQAQRVQEAVGLSD